jgi:hypothetical protein
MRKRILLSLTAAAATLGVIAACTADAPAGPQTTTYTATLIGANEVPPRVTPATGSATVTLIGTLASYSVTSSGFSAPPTAAHIHIGAAGTNGPIIVPLVLAAGVVAPGTFSVAGPLTSGTTTISGDSMRVLLENGNAYVNLHTAANPGGEIRGQLIRK